MIWSSLGLLVWSVGSKLVVIKIRRFFAYVRCSWLSSFFFLEPRWIQKALICFDKDITRDLAKLQPIIIVSDVIGRVIFTIWSLWDAICYIKVFPLRFEPLSTWSIFYVDVFHSIIIVLGVLGLFSLPLLVDLLRRILIVSIISWLLRLVIVLNLIIILGCCSIFQHLVVLVIIDYLSVQSFDRIVVIWKALNGYVLLTFVEVLCYFLIDC